MEDRQGARIPQRTRFERWLGMGAHERPHVYAQVYAEAELANSSYWLQTLFSAGIAAFGLVTNSSAVIIGAMLISPLMGPIMALGLALAVGDLYLSAKAIWKLLASVGLAVGLSAFMVWLLPFHSITSEILSRTNPNLLDLGIALFSGLAGSVAMCRSSSDSGVMTLPGVAIAVALMPPLCTMGFGLGDQANMRIMGGAGLLFLTNLVAIVASAFVIFLLIGMNTADVRLQMETSHRGDPLAQRLSRGPLSRVLAVGGQLRWRILMLAVLLAAIAVPLRTAFVQVAGETLVRNAVQDVARTLLPPGAVLSQQVDVERKSVAVHLISTSGVPADKLHEAEEQIEMRTGRRARITVSTVASQTELADLMQRLATPPLLPPKPPELSVGEMKQQLMQRVQPVIDAVWPTEAPLESFDLQLSPSGIVVNAQYASYRELGTVAQDMIERQLQQQLDLPDLSLKARRAPDSYRILAAAKKVEAAKAKAAKAEAAKAEAAQAEAATNKKTE